MFLPTDQPVLMVRVYLYGLKCNSDRSEHRRRMNNLNATIQGFPQGIVPQHKETASNRARKKLFLAVRSLYL